jgi:hypothetical protein
MEIMPLCVFSCVSVGDEAGDEAGGDAPDGDAVVQDRNRLDGW